MKEVFDFQAIHDLVLNGKSLVAKHSDNIFFVVGHQVFAHLRRDSRFYRESLNLLGFLAAASQLASSPSTDLL